MQVNRRPATTAQTCSCYRARAGQRLPLSACLFLFLLPRASSFSSFHVCRSSVSIGPFGHVYKGPCGQNKVVFSQCHNAAEYRERPACHSGPRLYYYQWVLCARPRATLGWKQVCPRRDGPVYQVCAIVPTKANDAATTVHHLMSRTRRHWPLWRAASNPYGPRHALHRPSRPRDRRPSRRAPDVYDALSSSR